MSVDIRQGDALTVLKTLPSESVHCVVTSPPYWGLRDYGTGRWVGGDAGCDHRSPTMQAGRNEDRQKLAGSAATNSYQNVLAHNAACGKCGAVKVDEQIGLERSLSQHIDALVTVFREVRRVLRKDGTLWLNYGDAYATAPNGRSAAGTKALGDDDRTFRDKPMSTIGPIYNPEPRVGKSDNKGNLGGDHRGRVQAGGTMKAKDRMLLPARVAIALHDDGWYVRDEIIWHKPNPMPSSVKDRTTPAHEMIYMLTKAERYAYDAAAIREPAAVKSWNDGTRVYGGTNKHGANAKHGERTTGRRTGRFHHPGAWSKGEGSHGKIHSEGRTEASYAEIEIDGTRQKRSVWTVPPKGFREAHFATFPPDLIRPCILAGCPVGGTVLDPFFGAGTTGLVAQELGRDCIGIELNPAYVTIAQDRLGMTDLVG